MSPDLPRISPLDFLESGTPHASNWEFQGSLPASFRVVKSIRVDDMDIPQSLRAPREVGISRRRQANVSHSREGRKKGDRNYATIA